MSQANEVSMKVVFVGEPDSGKSAALNRLANKPFEEQKRTTIDVDFKLIEKEIDSQNFRLQIWDTAGQERTSSMFRIYLRVAEIYSIFIDSTKDFEQQKTEIYKWRDTILDKMSKRPGLFIVVSTKCDLQKPNTESLENWLNTLPQDDDLIYAGTCSISSKNENVDNLKNLLFAKAKFVSEQVEIVEDNTEFETTEKRVLPKYQLSISRTDILALINKKHFPQEYSELLAEHNTVRDRVIALFEDYDSFGVFQWRGHREDARNLINFLKTLEVDHEQWLNILVTKYQQMSRFFNPEGDFAERLLLAIKLIDDYQSQHSAAPRPGM